MAAYLLIESRDSFESNDVRYYFELARGLADAGNQVSVFLVQNAVLAARESVRASAMRTLLDSRVKVFVDDFSMRERGIKRNLEGVEVAPIDLVIDRLEAGDKVLWH